MNARLVRQATIFALLGIALLAFSWTVWLASVLVATQVSVGDLRDAGPGVFLLVYVALPATVAASCLGHLVSTRRSRRTAFALGVVAFAVVLVESLWLMDLGRRAAAQPILFALSVIVIVAALAMTTARSGRRPPN